MLFELMRDVRNTFYDGYREYGFFSINDESIKLSGNFKDGCYVIITGGINSGVFKVNKSDVDKLYTIVGALDDSFSGTVYRLDVPPDFVNLTEEIKEYIKKAPDSNISSEKFGEYSYTLAKGSEGRSWEKIYAARLNKYRKMFDELLELLSGGTA